MIASQHSDTQALAELNQRSAVLGQWDVGIFRPAIHEWKYTIKSTRQPKTGKAFRCTLVSVLDPSQYVSAHVQMRYDNVTPLQEAEAKFKANLKFRISKVWFDSSAQHEYLHTPIKHRIELAKTKADALMQAKQGETVQPSPAMSIQDCKKLQRAHRFDVIAIMDSVSADRVVSLSRQVVSVTIIYHSGGDGKFGQ